MSGETVLVVELVACMWLICAHAGQVTISTSSPCIRTNILTLANHCDAQVGAAEHDSRTVGATWD